MKFLGDVRALRLRLEIEPTEMASLLGVSISSLYRWESASDGVSMDPMHRRLLLVIEDLTNRADAPVIARKIRDTLRTNGDGGLRALRVTLNEFFSEDGRIAS